MPLTIQILDHHERETCPQCGWIYYPHLKLGAGVLLEQQGRILLVQRKNEPWKGNWYLPAGYVEVNESPAQAAIREAREETGLEVQVDRLLDALFFTDDPRGNGLLILYRGKITGGSLRSSPETGKPQFFAPEEIPNNLAGGCHDLAIRAWQTEKFKQQATAGQRGLE